MSATTIEKEEVKKDLVDKGVISRESILNIESKIAEHPAAMFGDCFPLEHTFVDGAYVRKISMPKGMLVVSKIHKVTHPYFVMSGDVSVLTESGIVRIKGPYAGITEAGTKRILYTHENTEWITVHVTKETNLKKIVEEIIAKDFNELIDNDKKMDSFIEHIEGVYKC